MPGAPRRQHSPRRPAKRLGRDCSIGAVYTTLQRLENKGFVKSWTSDPTPVRGGRAKRFFRLEAGGEEALRASHEAVRKMMRGLRPGWEAR